MNKYLKAFLKNCLQHKFPKAPFPFRLVEEVVEMASESDENKTEC